MLTQSYNISYGYTKLAILCVVDITDFHYLEYDFEPGNMTVTFGSMDMYTNFTIKINDDNLLETAEQFNLSIVIPDITKDRGVEEGAPASAIARILNDDSKE